MITKDIYCSYWEIGNRQEPPLIDYWKTRWAREGWIPHVLSRKEAEHDARFESMVDKHKSTPHLPGHELYGMANFCRWLAFSHIDGAVCDYDVFPIRPFPPREFKGFTNGTPVCNPGFIVGCASDFSQIADDILAHKLTPQDQFNGIPHMCDMRILIESPERYDTILDLIGDIHNKPFGQGKPLVHFENTFLAPYDKVSRLEKTRALLEAVYP